ncbi:cation:proton antiporter [Streptomyces malaysiensis]|uniref:cation:proton antiporter n=1 Tax=Streptomyces malaysiensis TaxID=92644 RepID=UPI002B2D4F2C|nr:cation:proton antiporter [Streptomyces malaysiensis]
MPGPEAAALLQNREKLHEGVAHRSCLTSRGFSRPAVCQPSHHSGENCMTISVTELPPIAAHQMLVFLLQLAVLLVTAFLLGRLATRLNLAAVVGELAAGVILGPSLLAHLLPSLSSWLFPPDPGQIHLLDAVGQLGVLLLVGFTGMHIDLDVVRRRGRTAALVSAGGLIIPLGLGVAVGTALPASLMGEGHERPVFALFIGVAMCVSAIPVIAKTLVELRLLHRDIGQLTITAAAVDDIVGWALLSIISAMATTGLRAGHLALTLGSLALVLAVAYLVGRPAVRAGLTSNKTEDPAVTVAVVTVLTLASAAGTTALGLEPILGAFLCGILLSTSGLLDRRKLHLSTFVMAVLAPVFFATAGLRMRISPCWAGRPAVGQGWWCCFAIGGRKFVGAYLGAHRHAGPLERTGAGAGLTHVGSSR